MNDQNKQDQVTQEAAVPNTPNVAPSSKRWIFTAVLVVLLVGGGVVAAYYFMSKENSVPVPGGQIVVPGMDNPVPEEQPLPDTSGNFESWVKVAWEPKLFVQGDDCAALHPGGGEVSCGEYIVNYLAGEITDGKYDGQKIYLTQESGLGTSYNFYVLINGEKKDLTYEKIGVRGVDDLPSEINFPLKKGYKLGKGYRGQYLFSETKLVRKLFTDPVLGDAYLSDKGCIVFELPDHTAYSYDFDPVFIDEEKGIVDVQMYGKAVKEAYTFRVPTCGSDCFYWKIKEEDDLHSSVRLKVIGKTSNGEDIYGIVDQSDQALKDLYNDKTTAAYYKDGSYEQGDTSKYTYAQFLALNHLFYWKDPLDRWVEFKNAKVDVVAEMCKPVIYLYPQTAMDVHVEVRPNGGFTYTEPVYNNGWDVQATPDGRLTELSTGKHYDYLFWEGLGLAYPVDEKGFVVAQQDLEKFFDEKLVQLGLVGREIEDFKEYWLSRLVDKPYYKISFLNQDTFNSIAPLSVSGNPSTLIRVMMTATALEQYEDIVPQQFSKTPVRHGFSVVEWGGVLWD